jgi:hypothetical protein
MVVCVCRGSVYVFSYGNIICDMAMQHTERDILTIFRILVVRQSWLFIEDKYSCLAIITNVI